METLTFGYCNHVVICSLKNNLFFQHALVLYRISNSASVLSILNETSSPHTPSNKIWILKLVRIRFQVLKRPVRVKAKLHKNQDSWSPDYWALGHAGQTRDLHY